MEAGKAKSYRIPVILLSVLLAAAIAALIVIWVIPGKGSLQEETTRNNTFAMGTTVQQTLYGGDASQRNNAVKAGSQAIADLENRISWRTEGTDLYRLNQNAGKGAVSVSGETARLLQTALEVAQRSGGACDPTILPVSLLWNFSEHADIVPAESEIRSHLSGVGYRNLSVDVKASAAALKDPDAALNLDAIGKGAACDDVVKAYGQSGVSGGIVAVGGSVGVFGQKADGSKWNIAVRNPNSDATASMGTLSIEAGYVSTSGTYEQTFQQDGVTYHHILDPKTGYPAKTDLVSASVWCENGALSDALATACIVLGAEKAQQLLDSYGAGGVLITTDNKVTVTENLRDSFVITAADFTLQS